MHPHWICARRRWPHAGASPYSKWFGGSLDEYEDNARLCRSLLDVEVLLELNELVIPLEVLVNDKRIVIMDTAVAAIYHSAKLSATGIIKYGNISRPPTLIQSFRD